MLYYYSSVVLLLLPQSNMMSMVTHTIPYLGTYNPNRGYGGGFGLGQSAGAMTKAAVDVKNAHDSIYTMITCCKW